MSESFDAKRGIIKGQDIADMRLHEQQVERSLRRMNVYQSLASLLTRREGLHINMSSFLGAFPASLLCFPNLDILSVQRNPAIAARQLELLRNAQGQQGAPRYQLHDNRGMTLEEDANGMVHRKFALMKEEWRGKLFAVFERSVTVILDELDTMNVTGEILGNRKVGSASITFPVYNLSRTIEHPFPTKAIPQKLAYERLAPIFRKEMQGACLFASKRVQQGGELLFGLDTKLSVMTDIIREVRVEMMKEYSVCWDGPRYKNAGIMNSGRTVSLMRFTRNDRPVPA
ncbi:hypothetical protein HZA87_05675 [Candidatus Uhrbacteria bacterium]|nr:hypothetical protein [Candidatus Uhrbacteria bacterium]